MVVLTLFGVFVDASIRAEEAHPCHACDRLGQPLVLVLVRRVNGRMCLDVAVEVVRDQVVVAMVTNSRDHCEKVVGRAKGAVLNCLEYLVQIRVDSVRAVRVSMAKVFDILREVSKEEDVVLADLTSDLDLYLHVSKMSEGRRVAVATAGEEGYGIHPRMTSLNLRLHHHMCQ